MGASPALSCSPVMESTLRKVERMITVCYMWISVEGHRDLMVGEVSLDWKHGGCHSFSYMVKGKVNLSCPLPPIRLWWHSLFQGGEKMLVEVGLPVKDCSHSRNHYSV